MLHVQKKKHPTIPQSIQKCQFPGTPYTLFIFV